MSDSDSLVHQYLLTVSAKLAKQFTKKKPGLAPWTGPTLEQLIDFYKRNRKEEVVTADIPTTETQTNGSCDVAPPPTNGTNGVAKKRGKKRKLSELNNSVSEVPASQPSDQATADGQKKKKKKKKKNKNKSPEVVEIIQVAEDSPKTEETPEETPEPEPADVETPVSVPPEQDINPTPVETTSAEEVIVPGGLVTSVQEEGEDRPNKKSKLKRKKSNSSFRRVKEEEVTIKKAELADNAFEAKGGADEYGYKANQILKFTKGKSFRHEKTKKKRGTYKGGAINMGVTSIKFDSDSD